MAQSLTKIYLHVAFSTQGCAPHLAAPELRRETHRFMAHQCRGLRSPALAIGGAEDHVHLLIHLSRVSSIAHLIGELKRSTSLWLKRKSKAMEWFDWQDGYWAFSISPSHVEPLRNYIEFQDEHHRLESFDEEICRLENKYERVCEEIRRSGTDLDILDTQSMAKIFLHIVFSTKHRLPFLTDPDLRQKTHHFMAQRCKILGCPAITVGGVSDHVHLLICSPRTESVARLIGELKRSTSIWIKAQARDVDSFYWQKGYGAFSISPSHVKALHAYISNQEEHHRRESFQDETRRLAARYGVRLDERRAWD